MAITSLDNYINSNKTNLTYYKSGSVTCVAGIPFSVFNQAGNPGTGALAGGQATTNWSGLLCNSTVTSGYITMPTINNTAYISRVDYGSSVACRMGLYDRLTVAGPFAISGVYNWAQTPVISGRVPYNNFNQVQLWVETTAAFTGNPSFQISYTNAVGASGNTGAVGTGAALTVNRCFQMPISGGIQSFNYATSTVASAGAYNVMLLRPLWTGRVNVASAGDVHDFLKTGLPIVYSGTALYCMIFADSTATGTPYLTIELADG